MRSASPCAREYPSDRQTLTGSRGGRRLRPLKFSADAKAVANAGKKTLAAESSRPRSTSRLGVAAWLHAEPFVWTKSKVHQRRVKGRRLSDL
jgi:hypothetical protein